KRALTPNYDPAQSPLFSVGVRKINETTMSPNRTSTNLKSNVSIEEKIRREFLL
ncbi:unnamed protein product, partial [Rotaria magnacalcarata]